MDADVLDGRCSYAAMWPMRGCRYDSGTLVIGRAVNSWSDTEWRVRDVATAHGRKRVVARARRVSEPGSRCAMSWVSDCWGAPRGEYSSKTSAFWRTVRAAVGAGDGECWLSNVSWSNLYKVAPAAGGNPSDGERYAMFDSAVKLLRLEVSALRPRRVLVLAGRCWFEPFAAPLGLRVQWGHGDLVGGTALETRTTWVIAAHPQGKNESALVAHARRAFAR